MAPEHCPHRLKKLDFLHRSAFLPAISVYIKYRNRIKASIDAHVCLGRSAAAASELRETAPLGRISPGMLGKVRPGELHDSAHKPAQAQLVFRERTESPEQGRSITVPSAGSCRLVPDPHAVWRAKGRIDIAWRASFPGFVPTPLKGVTPSRG
jgi:hypothetical protein